MKVRTFLRLLMVETGNSVINTSRGVDHHAYDPFGGSNGSRAFCSAYRGAIKERMGLYLLGNGARCYHPALMRFGSADSASPLGSGGFNAYAYCAADPVNRHDPEGRAWKALVKLLKKSSNEPIEQITLEKITIKAPHITENILSYLDTSSLIAVRRTSRTLKSAADFVSDRTYSTALQKRDSAVTALEFARRVHYQEIPGVMPYSAHRRGLTLRYIQEAYPTPMVMPAPAPAYVNRGPNVIWFAHPDRDRVPMINFGGLRTSR
jgi:RHS repeat-associated protein